MQNSKHSGAVEFVVYAPPFSLDSGGAIVLHYLCKLLSINGFRAAIWPNTKPIMRGLHALYPHNLVRVATGLYMHGFETGPWQPQIANLSNVRDAYVVYPEVVEGNPLGAKKVARWLLHKEGHFLPNVKSSKEDVLFYYNSAFLGDATQRKVGGELSVTYIPEEYKTSDHNTLERIGTCFHLRKSAGQPILHSKFDMPLDGLSHGEIADAFGAFQFYISYDLYSMYSYFAAMRGCIPIVVPIEGLPEEEWQPDVRLRWGIAYGQDRIDWAINTRPLLLKRIAEIYQMDNFSVIRFAETCRRYAIGGV